MFAWKLAYENSPLWPYVVNAAMQVFSCYSDQVICDVVMFIAAVAGQFQGSTDIWPLLAALPSLMNSVALLMELVQEVGVVFTFTGADSAISALFT